MSASLEEPACALCGARQNQVIMRGLKDSRYRTQGVWRIVRCVRCRLAYLSPRPDRAAIGAYYPEGTEEHQVDQTHFATAERQLVSRLHPGAGTVLDVGCAAGAFLAAMAESGWAAFGVELSPEAARLAARYGKVHIGTIESAPFSSESFDLVTFWSVIEHTHDPIAALARARRLLNPDGIVILGLPNFGGLERRMFGQHWFGLDVPRHLYHFDPATITAALRSARFCVKETHHSSGHDSLARSLRAVTSQAGGPRGLTGAAATGCPGPGGLASWRAHMRGYVVQKTLQLVDRVGAGSQLIVVATPD